MAGSISAYSYTKMAFVRAIFSIHLFVLMPEVSRFNPERDARLHIERLEREVQALTSTNQNYRGIIENMELGILEVNLEEEITRAYPKFCELVEYSEAELLGKNAKDLLLDVTLHDNMDEQSKNRNNGVSGLYEMPLRTRSGRVKWLLISGVPIRNVEGQIVGSMGTHYDITERKAEEEALRKAKDAAERAQQAEREFLARMSHEIRTPLNAIIGMANLMSGTGLNEEQLHFLGAIQDGSLLLHRVLSGLLDLSKLDAKQMEVKLVPTVPATIITGVVRSFSPLLSAKNVAIHTHLSEDMGQSFLMDGTILTQVLLNLIGNATKFTKEGSIEISAQWSPGKGAEGRVRVEVKDTGIGIENQDLDSVFDRFKQASNREIRHGGTGLGLALVKEMCLIHGGDVSVKSEPGLGSSFVFYFSTQKANVLPAASPLSKFEWEGLRVLVAEDNEVNVFIVKTLLERWGCELVIVGDGLSAIDAAKNHAFDLILMDLEMPLCSGQEAAEQIRAQERATVTLPIPMLGISAFAFEEDKLQALKAGMDGYLSKPYTEAELKGAIENLLLNPRDSGRI